MQTPQTINDMDGKFIVDYCKEQGRTYKTGTN